MAGMTFTGTWTINNVQVKVKNGEVNPKVAVEDSTNNESGSFEESTPTIKSCTFSLDYEYDADDGAPGIVLGGPVASTFLAKTGKTIFDGDIIIEEMPSKAVAKGLVTGTVKGRATGAFTGVGIAVPTPPAGGGGE